VSRFADWFESLRLPLNALATKKVARYLMVLALGVFILFGLLTELRLLVIKSAPHYLLEDFHYYQRAYLAATHGGNPYQDRTIGTGFLYPPPALLLVGVFTLIPGDAALDVAYIGVNLVLLAVMLRGVGQHYGLAFGRVWWWYPLAFAFAPFLELLYVGQVNLITAFGIFLMFVYAERRPALAGFGLSLAICLKVTPLIFVFYLLVQRRRSALIWTGAFLVIECIAAALFFSWRPLTTYPDVFFGLLNVAVPGDGNSQALGSVLNYQGWIAFSAIQPVQRLLSLAMLVIFALSSLMAYVARQREPLFLVLSLGIMVSPNIMWYHHYVFILLPVFVWIVWSRLHPAVMAWLFMGLVLIQLDRWFLTRGLLAQLFVDLSILGILTWQISRALSMRRGRLEGAPLSLAAGQAKPSAGS